MKQKPLREQLGLGGSRGGAPKLLPLLPRRVVCPKCPTSLVQSSELPDCPREA